MTAAVHGVGAAHAALDRAGAWLAPLGLRIILAWEYGDAGITKLRGTNWFAHIQADFPFPFNVLSADFSWALATWAELIGAAALVVGFATRIFSATLMVLTVVAIAAVHWPSEWATFGDLLRGYAITDRGHGNYKLPLIFLVMFVPLLMLGPGKASVDHWLQRAMRARL